MEYTSRTVIGKFESLSEAQQAKLEIEREGFTGTIRLVENDYDQVTPSSPSSSTESFRSNSGGGISGFFSRLFGLDDDVRPAWSLQQDSENYFKTSYESKQHLLIITHVQDISRARDIIVKNDGIVEERGSQFYEQELRQLQDLGTDTDRVMRLNAEQLKVEKQKVQTGEVTMRKEIIQETKTIEVPVTREELVIERTPLHGTPIPGSLETVAESNEELMRVTLSEEEVLVRKEVVPTEEIRLGKEKISETKRVSENVRHEEVRIQGDKTKIAKAPPSEKRDRDLERDRPGL